MSKIKYRAVDSRGKVHTRTTTHRIYSHCVVAHIAARPATGIYRASPAHDCAEWAGRLDLAQNVARRWQRSRSGLELEGVEILIAQQVSS